MFDEALEHLAKRVAELVVERLPRETSGRVPPDPLEMLTTGEVATLLKVHQVSLKQWRGRRGTGPPYVRIGRSIRYRRRDVEAWMEEIKDERRE
ncbi:MAG: helix-turn-helix domain-containing protein [bacterium]|nr:helix-turn-helix domain-containing protein [bacterium]